MATTIESRVNKRVSSGVMRTVFFSVLAGALLTSIWSFEFVDSVIGDNVANNLLGYDAKATPIGGAVAGALFAFITGIAGTFTACNICAFSALAPLAAEKRTLGGVLSPLKHLALGLILVSALYGAIGALIGPGLPQLSTARLGDPETGLPVRLLQSTTIFVTIGVIFVIWGLMTVEILPPAFAKIRYRYPWARMVFMGALIGGFLIGRPFPLFRKMFEFAASTHNPFYGSMVFVLQALGNIVIMVALFLFLMYGTGGRFERWLTAKPNRAQRVTAVALLVGGVFFITYWGLRVPSIFGYGWYPTVSW